jgi:hypothetical protein
VNPLIALLALAGLIAGIPAAALAQTGWVVLPTFTLAEEFDDNVFVSTTDPKSDFITRMTPALQLGYRSVPFTLLASGSIDAEIYANNPELSDAANRKRAALEMKYLPFRLLTVSLNVTYFETNTPSELVPTTGLQLARTRATQLAIIPAATYQITSVDTATASYAFFHDTLEGGVDNDTHRVKAGYARQLTPLDTGFINYRLHVFENQGSPTTITNTPTLGWKRQLTPTTVLTLEGGTAVRVEGAVVHRRHGGTGSPREPRTQLQARQGGPRVSPHGGLSSSAGRARWSSRASPARSRSSR